MRLVHTKHLKLAIFKTFPGSQGELEQKNPSNLITFCWHRFRHDDISIDLITCFIDAYDTKI